LIDETEPDQIIFFCHEKDKINNADQALLGFPISQMFCVTTSKSKPTHNIGKSDSDKGLRTTKVQPE
jgi:hypothetical protein